MINRIVCAVILVVFMTASVALSQDQTASKQEADAYVQNNTVADKDVNGSYVPVNATSLNATAMGTAAGDPWDMNRAVDRGLKANPEIVAARKQLIGSEFGRRSAMADFFPSATVNYGYTHNGNPQKINGSLASPYDTWAMNLNLSQPVFTGFNLLSTYQKAALTKDQNKSQMDYVELNLIRSIQTSFLSLLKARMDVKSSEDSVARYQSQLKVNEAFYQVGLKPKVDVLRTEVELATEQQTLLSNQNTVKTEITRLNTLLNLPANSQTNYVGDLKQLPFKMKLDECLDVAYKNRPDLMIGRKSVEIATKDSDIVASAFYPQVSADLDYYKNGEDPGLSEGKHLSNSQKEYWTVGVNLSYKFFQWGSTYYSYKQSLENVGQLEATLADTRLNATYQVQASLLQLQNSADRIGVGQKSVIAAKESYRMAVARYQAQVGTNTEVLDAQAGLTQSEAQLNSALADYKQALSNLYFAMGIKNPSLNTMQ